jgi:hypothetical protein
MQLEQEQTLKDFEILAKKIELLVTETNEKLSIVNINTMDKEMLSNQLRQFAILSNKLFQFQTLKVRNTILTDWLEKNKDWVGELK